MTPPSPRTASYFPNAKHFVINDGVFSNVQGNQNQFNWGSGPFQMNGRDSAMMTVNGTFQNGPTSNIMNKAGGNIDVYGQGDRCDVRLGTMGPQLDIERAQPRPSSAPPLPTGYMAPNSEITNSADGDIRVTGQGRDTRVWINNHPPQQPYPYQPQQNATSPQQMMGNLGMPSQLSPLQYNHPSHPLPSFTSATAASGCIPHQQHQYNWPPSYPASGVNNGASDIRPHIDVASPTPAIPRPLSSASPLPLRPQGPDLLLPGMQTRSAPATPSLTTPTSSAPHTVVTGPPLITRKASPNGAPQSLPPSSQADMVCHSTRPQEDSEMPVETLQLSVPDPALLTAAMGPTASQVTTPSRGTPLHSNQDEFPNRPLQIPENKSVLVGSKSTIVGEQELSQVHNEKGTINSKRPWFRRWFSRLIKHFKKVR